MHNDLMAGYILQNTFVSRRKASLVMLRLEPIDGHCQVQIVEQVPLGGDRPDSAGDQLHFDSQPVQFRQQHIQLAEAHQRLASDNRHMQRTKPPDQFQNLFDQLGSAEIAELPKFHPAAQMVRLVRVAARTAQWAFLGNFDR